MARLKFERPDGQAIVARLAGAGSMRAELEAVLSQVPEDSGASDYRKALLEENAAGKGTLTGRTWAWKRLKLRYGLDRPESAEFRAFNCAMTDLSPGARGLTCALMFARLDRLFREVTLAKLSPWLAVPGTILDSASVRSEVEDRMAGANLRWSDESLANITAHTLSTWKDFALVAGSKERRTVPIHPTHSTAVFAARLGRLEGLTDRQILSSRWFALLGLDEADVTTHLYDAARAGVLGFRSQADVVELDLPAATHSATGD